MTMMKRRKNGRKLKLEEQAGGRMKSLKSLEKWDTVRTLVCVSDLLLHSPTLTGRAL
jgi:hypothetical protein